MKIIPAIDLLQGKAVRLRKGDRNQSTVYSDKPWELVEELTRSGAERLHVVDLDGAFAGERKHSDVIAQILDRAKVPVQVGGGLRNREAIDGVLAAGASFAVLGTAAIKAPAMVEEACTAHPGRIIIAVDAIDGKVAVEGWVEASEVTASELAKQAARWAAAGILYTDVSRDGTHEGPNVEATAALVDAVAGAIPVIASGGIGSLDHVRALAQAGVPFAIVGRAIYDRHFTVEEAISAAAEG
jgi:phosphoribosylformimino-5-aminoimidazole carboxamide ribotide isomerase